MIKHHYKTKFIKRQHTLNQIKLIAFVLNYVKKDEIDHILCALSSKECMNCYFCL